jgi:hypothetical protein
MQQEPNQLGGCRREVDDCCRLLTTELSPQDRIAVLRRIQVAREQLRELEDELLLSVME